MKKLKTAIIGCGAIAPLHADGLVSCSGAQLYAVCDIVESKAAAMAEKYGCKYFTDYRQVLDDPEVDAIHICTPHYLHAPIAIAAMKKGKHVLTEKPIAIKSADAEEMIRVSEETGKTLGVCFQNRYNTTSKRAKEIIASGKAGKIRGGKAIVTWKRDKDYYDSGEWRGTWEYEGGGVLINQSIHTLDLLQWFISNPVRLQGSASTRILKDCIEVEDTADATILFKDGARALFYATNCYIADSNVEIEIIGESAVLKLAGNLTVNYSDGTTETVTETDIRTGEKAYWGTGHAVLIEDFYKCINEGKPFPIDGRQAITALKMIEAIYSTSKSGEMQDI